MNGQSDGNDGRFQGENWYVAPNGEFPYPIEGRDADIIWSFDLRQQLGMCPHDSPHASILLDGNLLYINTCNGVDYRHLESACLTAPSLIVLNKNTGKLVAQDNESFAERIFHSSWSSPSMGIVNGEKLVFFAGGDGLMYAFDAIQESDKSDEIKLLNKVWETDCDPNAPKENIHDYLKNREESPSSFLGMPVFCNNKIYVTVGGDIWWGKQETWLKCLDAATGQEIWSTPLDKHTAATPAISKGLVYVTDCGKNLHCIDAETGKSYWKHKLGKDSWSSALVADGKVYVGSRGSDFWILKAGKHLDILCSAKLDSPIHSTPFVANGILFISTMNKLYAIEAR
jgi:outer membrane protein assembly factor BamB